MASIRRVQRGRDALIAAALSPHLPVDMLSGRVFSQNKSEQSAYVVTETDAGQKVLLEPYDYGSKDREIPLDFGGSNIENMAYPGTEADDATRTR